MSGCGRGTDQENQFKGEPKATKPKRWQKTSDTEACVYVTDTSSDTSEFSDPLITFSPSLLLCVCLPTEDIPSWI